MHGKVLSIVCHFLSNQQLRFQGVGGAEVTLCHSLSLYSSFIDSAWDIRMVFIICHCHSQVVSLCGSSTCLSNSLCYIDGSRMEALQVLEKWHKHMVAQRWLGQWMWSRVKSPPSRGAIVEMDVDKEVEVAEVEEVRLWSCKVLSLMCWMKRFLSSSGVWPFWARTMQVGRCRLSMYTSCCFCCFSSSIWAFRSALTLSSFSDSCCRDSVFSFFLLRHLAAAILFLSLLLFLLSCSWGVNSLLTPDPLAWCSEARSELELAPSELMSTLSPFESRLVWMARRSSSFTMGVKLVKSSRVSVPGGERQGTRAEQLISASEGPECCSIIL